MKFLLAFLILGSIRANASAPEWYFDYTKTFPGCDRELLCAVGGAETQADALTEARTEVAKFFETKIKSNSKVSTTSEQKGINPALGMFEEWTNKTVSVETNELISGLEVRKQEQMDGQVYVLLALDRTKAAGLLKEKILALDAENAQLLELNSRFTYPKVLKNLGSIEIYNDRYTLLSQASNKILLKVKKAVLQNKMNKLIPMRMALLTRGKKLPAKLNHNLIDLLAPLKVVIVSAKHNPPYTLRGEVVTEEQYFKVDGFKKLNVVYKLELRNSKNIVIGKLSTFSEQVARNSDHAIEKAIPDIKEALQNNLDQLSSK